MNLRANMLRRFLYLSAALFVAAGAATAAEAYYTYHPKWSTRL